MTPRDCSEALFAARPHQSLMIWIRRLVEERTDQPASPLSGTSATPAQSCDAVSSQLRNSNVKDSKIGIVTHRCSGRFYGSAPASSGESSAGRGAAVARPSRPCLASVPAAAKHLATPICGRAKLAEGSLGGGRYVSACWGGRLERQAKCCPRVVAQTAMLTPTSPTLSTIRS
jgi:hypothetical protein